MRKGIIATTISLLLCLFITQSNISNRVIDFLLTGVVPGTAIIVPFWVMMAIYCAGITIIITAFVEAMHPQTHSISPKQLPRRRYSHL